MSKIGNVNFVRQKLNENGLLPDKKFGQNFLIDQNVLNRIIAAAEADADTLVIEIGGGLGALTERLCEEAGLVVTYEIDKRLVPVLKDNLKHFDNVVIKNEDILKADLASVFKEYNYSKVIVVANLPYYITTPIILNCLQNYPLIKRYVVMMQLEVADRICGKPQTKDYNALSLMVQYRAKAFKVLKVPRSVFIPAPNVDSAVVKLEVYDKPTIDVLQEEDFFNVIRICFTQRRKTIYNNLIQAYPKDFVDRLLADLNIAKSLRAEALDIATFGQISDYITQNYK